MRTAKVGFLVDWQTLGRLAIRFPFSANGERSIWYLVFGIWYLVFGIWYLVFGIWYLVFGIWYLVFGIWYLVFGIWYLVFGIWYLVFGIWYRDQKRSTVSGQRICPLRLGLSADPPPPRSLRSRGRKRDGPSCFSPRERSECWGESRQSRGGGSFPELLGTEIGNAERLTVDG